MVPWISEALPPASMLRGIEKSLNVSQEGDFGCPFAAGACHLSNRPIAVTEVDRARMYQKSQLRLNIPVGGFGKREPIVTLSALVTESAEYQAQQRCFSL